MSNKQRCQVCGWPLADSRDRGCVEGDCSMRGITPPPRYDENDELARLRKIEAARVAWLTELCRRTKSDDRMSLPAVQMMLNSIGRGEEPKT